jgi:hypothetical protein
MWHWRTIGPPGSSKVFRGFDWRGLCTTSSIRPPSTLLYGTLAALLALGNVCWADAKRDVPDYDGRGNPEADVDSWALWFPRVLLFPLYATNEYLMRRPVGAVFVRAERGRWTDAVAEAFRFGEGGKTTLFPMAAFDFGLRPSVSAYYARDDLLAPGNRLAIRASTWGARWVDVAAADRYAIDPADRVELRGELERGRDELFVGLGPDATDATRSRYGLARIDGELGFRRRLSETAWLDAGSGLRHTEFLDGACCGDPSLDARIARGELMAPPRYREPFTAAFARIALGIDTRRRRPEPGGGGFARVHGRPSVAGGNGSWIAYGGVVGGALDLTGHRRTLTAELALDFVDPVSGPMSRGVPFTEYPVLGGDAMAGFVAGWLTGRSTAAAQLAYRWPIWLGLDARTRVALGNAFGDHLTGLAPRALRLSGDVGLVTGSDQDRNPGFELLLGVGTETFEQGGHVTSVRIAIGSRQDL